MYDSFAYSVAWELTKRLPKRVLFICEDAIKIARGRRKKRFVVVEEPHPDTIEMWFGRYVVGFWSFECFCLEYAKVYMSSALLQIHEEKAHIRDISFCLVMFSCS